MSSHGKQEITDPVEEMLKKTGCIDLHYKVQVKINIWFQNCLINIMLHISGVYS